MCNIFDDLRELAESLDEHTFDYLKDIKNMDDFLENYDDEEKED